MFPLRRRRLTPRDVKTFNRSVLRIRANEQRPCAAILDPGPNFSRLLVNHNHMDHAAFSFFCLQDNSEDRLEQSK